MIIRIGFIFSLALTMQSCYTISQAVRFNSLFNSRQKVDRILADESYSAKNREKLQLSRKVLAFAKEQGINTQGAYGYYIHTTADSVSYSVQAAEKLRLHFKTWWFPIVGRVPYLGYFEESERDRMAAELEASYDVHKGKIGAFSSLGWFEDPIYTSMLKRSDSSLAHLFFHELIHRTFWSKGSTRFNENLAEFGAETLTEKWLLKTNGQQVVAKYHQRRQDRALYRSWIKKLKSELSTLYKNKALSDDEKLTKKAQTIKHFQTEMMPNFRVKGYKSLIKKNWNNASLLGASLYTPDTARFAAAYVCLGSPKIGDMLKAIENAEQLIDDVFKAMDSLCQKSDS